MPTASVVITTRNRRYELRAAIASALQQTARPQVLVVDDGSTDGTAEMVRGEFPAVTLHREETSRGYIAQRNRGAELATSDVVFSIDDDAAFSTPHVVEQTLAEFGHPRIGAVAIPFINVNREKTEWQRAPQPVGVFAAPYYIGTAHAVRRDLFLSLGGYRPQLVHQGEERDFCIRLLAAGYVVALGRSDPIHHFESPRRDTTRMDLYGRRNDILFGWHNAPLLDLPLRWLRTTTAGLIHGVRSGHPLRMIRGLAWGYASTLGQFSVRTPVSRRVYRLHRRLVERGAVPLAEIEPQLPPIAPPAAR